MRYYAFEIVIEKEPDDAGYLAHSPTLPGCFSNGRTIEETNATFGKPSSCTSRRSGRTGKRFRSTSGWCTLRS
jgi:hypothetical protein